MTNQEKLNHLATAISENLQQANASHLGNQWERALIYAEARGLFKTNKSFGDWIKERSEFELRTGRSKFEVSGVISKLIKFTTIMTKEDYIRLGYAKSEKLAVQVAWDLFSEQMRYLVSVAHTMIVPEVVQAVLDVRAGKQFIKPPAPPKSDADIIAEIKAEAELLRAEILVLRGQYRFSEEEFFHPQLKELQLKELAKGGAYAHFLFGLGAPGSFGEEEVTKSYRALSQKYHPDKVGAEGEEVMAVINGLREHFGNVLQYTANLSEKVEKAAKSAEWQERVQTARARMQERKAQMES